MQEKHMAGQSQDVSTGDPLSGPLVQLTVNDKPYRLEIGTRPGQIDPAQPLAVTLREALGLTGTKVSCDHGACGGCTVIMDGRTVLSVCC